MVWYDNRLSIIITVLLSWYCWVSVIEKLGKSKIDNINVYSVQDVMLFVYDNYGISLLNSLYCTTTLVEWFTEVDFIYRKFERNTSSKARQRLETLCVPHFS